MTDVNGSQALPPKCNILLVDDDDVTRESLRLVLQHSNFEVYAAATVNEALRLIALQPFDALLTDLNMPGAGDGLTVVSAMRHANPLAVTIILSGSPRMELAARTIMHQADEVLTKPLAPPELVRAIHATIEKGVRRPPVVENIATVLEQSADRAINDWLLHVDLEPAVAVIRLSAQERSAHLPKLFSDLVYRLRHPLPLGSHAHVSSAAAAHGLARRQQRYTSAMLVEESRMLQVCIFNLLQEKLSSIDFHLLLAGVMAIADEVDSQLAQTMASFNSDPATRERV
jgi:DNA-binding response OmpR family regulator